MSVSCLHDKAVVEAFYRRDVDLYLYQLASLDEAWSTTAWYGLEEEGEARQLLALHGAGPQPALMALSREAAGMRALLEQFVPLLPRRCYAHVAAGAAAPLLESCAVLGQDRLLRMALAHPAALDTVDTAGVVALTPDDREEIDAFYHEEYPQRWLLPRMLDTGYYYALRQDGCIASIAGVHFHSARCRVAALGNVVTRADRRGRGLAKRVCARLCRDLLKTVDSIGLNVRAGNTPAIAGYRRIGFETVVEFEEYVLDWRCTAREAPG